MVPFRSSSHVESPASRRRSAATVVAMVAVVALLGACGSDKDDASSSPPPSKPAALRVPDQYPTIQGAVDAAKDGEFILIAPGTYKESVTVETPNLTLRGLDRNTVIVDGEFKNENGIKIVSNGVTIENLTVRNNLQNGVFFTGSYSDDVSKNQVLTGYRASYITAYNNGLYGVYAFNSTKGQFDHSYGSGHPDSAFYIGQCNPCDAVLTDLVAEKNMLGYSGTNSTGVTIVNSVFRGNRAGIVPNSLNSEKLAPNAGTYMAGNLVENNNATDAPDNKGFSIAYGNGVVLGGTSNSVVTHNLIRGHKNAGVVVTDMPDGFKPEKNKVTDNTVGDNTMDLAYLTVNFASTPFGNCFAGNVSPSGGPAVEFPEQLQARLTCPTPQDVDLGDLTPILAKLTAPPPDVDYKTVPAPGPQTTMPDAETAPVRPASAGPTKVDIATVTTPKG